MEVELLPGNIWVQAEGWFLGLAVVCCHGGRIGVFLDGLAKEWEDGASFIAIEQKALAELSNEYDASGDARRMGKCGGMSWYRLR
eukprot:3931103-Ditylum_brightwellii.AAC.1